MNGHYLSNITNLLRTHQSRLYQNSPRFAHSFTIMINDLEFNQDFTSLSVATSSGHSIFTTDPFGEYYSSFRSSRRKSVVSSESGDIEDTSDVCPTKFIKMLFSTSLTIIVLEAEPRQLEIHNLKQHVKICTIKFDSAILDIKLNKTRLVVATKTQLSVYDLSCVKLVDTILYKQGPFDLAGDDQTLALGVENVDKLSNIWDKEFPICHPENKKLSPKQLRGRTGYVILYNTIENRPVLAFKAHDGAIGNVALHYGTNGIIIATASTKGTIVRVFNADSNAVELVSAFRRGHNPSPITRLVFGQEAHVVGCASESTIHIFDLEVTSKPEETDGDLDDNLASLLITKEEKKKSMMSGIIKKLPYKNLLEPKRASAYVSLAGNHRVELGFSGDSVYVASYDQEKLLVYQLPKKREDRRPCQLVHEYGLINKG